MNSEHKQLSEQIKTLEKKIGSLAEYLKSALTYLDSDPQSSLTKCRIVLEKMLTSIYQHEMGKKPPKKGMIGDILSAKEFVSKVPPRIRARMNFIREMANSGTHGEDIAREDAIQVLQLIVFVAEWYVTKYDLYNPSRFETSQSAEILPQLKELYPNYLHPDITSVKFGQTKDRCYLEIATKKVVGGYLLDELIERKDLGFVCNGDMDGEDSLFFNPKNDLTENAIKFVNELDEISIINCTDLFTEESSTMIYEYWNKNGVCPP